MPIKVATIDDAARTIREVAEGTEQYTAALDRGPVEAAKAADKAEFHKVARYLPRHELDAGNRKIDEKHEKEHVERQRVESTRFGVLVNDQPDYQAAIAHHAEAHGIVEAYEQHSGREGTSEQGYLLLLNLETNLAPQIQARIAREKPAATAGWYEALLETPNEPRANVAIRLLEAAHRDRWTGAEFDPLSEPVEVEGLRRLQQKIAEVRTGRVPDAIKQAADAVAKAKKLLDKQMQIRKLTLVSRYDAEHAERA